MIQKVSFMGNPNSIRRIQSRQQQVIGKAKQTITEYSTKDGKQITESITEYLDKDGKQIKKGITKIVTCLDNGQPYTKIISTQNDNTYKVEEIINGHSSIYTTDGKQVIKIAEEGVETHLHIRHWLDLIKI